MAFSFGSRLITSSGRHIQISGKRYCSKCAELTDQICHKVRYHQKIEEAGTLLKESHWVCSKCLTESEDVKAQPLPTDKVRIISRLLKMQEDHAITSMNIASQPDRLVIEITVKD